MSTNWQIDHMTLLCPVTKPRPSSLTDVQLVRGRCSRHWGLIRGLIVSDLVQATASGVPVGLLLYVAVLPLARLLNATTRSELL